MSTQPKPISATTLAQYVKLDNCERFLRFRLVPEDADRLEKRWGLTIQPLTPLLRESGSAFEVQVMADLQASGTPVVDMEGQDQAETLRVVREARRPVYLLQPQLGANLGEIALGGRADVVKVTPHRSGRVDLLVVDIKASRVERADHRLQVAVYARLLEQMLRQDGLEPGTLSGAILTQPDPTTRAVFPEQAGFDLDTYLTILDRLLDGPEAVVQRLRAAPFEQVFYHLGPKCDGCLYNAVCMYSAAEARDLALTPHISAVEKRVLLENGVRDLPALAALMDLPAEGTYGAPVPASGQQAVVEALKNRWPLGASLPLLVQRARAVLAANDRDMASRPYLLKAGFGNLPDEAEHPGLVKIFFDVQHDYLTDRIYLAAALVVGPLGRRSIVCLSPNPPGDDDEAHLLESWVGQTLAALPQVAAAAQAPVHLYAYNRYDQKVLLAALKRHLSRVVSIPAFFDLLTQTPALNQAIISFLADELAERANPGLTCAPLHDIARRFGFDWQDERHAYYQVFRARMFDNRRDVLRRADGSLAPLPDGLEQSAPGRERIESASRFNSQIPLEYAYGAWGCLPENPEDAEERRLLRPFRAVDGETLKAFAAHRLLALAHLEG
jgi:hypothetical protein